MKDSNPHSGLDAPLDASEEYPRLREAMKALTFPRVDIPERVDEAVRREAERRLRRVVPRVRTRSLVWRWIPAGLAACLAWVLWVHQKPGAGENRVRLRGDVDGSGRVDIVDAMLLARRLQQDSIQDASVDVNGDGVVDALDVQWVAETAVRWVEGGGI